MIVVALARLTSTDEDREHHDVIDTFSGYGDMRFFGWQYQHPQTTVTIHTPPPGTIPSLPNFDAAESKEKALEAMLGSFHTSTRTGQADTTHLVSIQSPPFDPLLTQPRASKRGEARHMLLHLRDDSRLWLPL